MTGLPLVSADDMVPSKGKENTERSERSERRFEKVIVRKKEKPVRVVRIKYYEKVSLSHNDIFVVERSLDELLKALYCKTNIEGMIPPSGGIFVEKDSRMVSNDKFLFINIDKDELNILKKQLENHNTICALNKGEFSILEGGRTYLRETFDMPKLWKDRKGLDRISDTNTIIARQRLREELKGDLRAYHSYSDDDIDNMTEIELKNLKKLAGEKRKLESRKIKAARKWKK